VLGLWGIGEYAVDLQVAIFGSHYQAQAPSGANAAVWVKQHVDSAKNLAYILQMVGGAVGMWLFTRVANGVSRRFAFLVGFSAAALITFFVYWKMDSPQDAYWMMPLMGAAQFAVFAGFAIYLPELFPSRLRSTGTSFCYNFGRFAAAAGSFFSANLSKGVFGSFPSPAPFRYSAMIMCVIFFVGIVALIWAPETKGKALPEE
jgi:MFS family permease